MLGGARAARRDPRRPRDDADRGCRATMPVHIGERLHALDRRAQRVRVGSLAVVNVAGDEDVVNAIALGVRAEPLDGGKTRLPQRLLPWRRTA